MPPRLAIAALGCLLSLSFLIGCSSNGPPKEDDATKDLGHIARVYALIVQGRRRPPSKLEEISTGLAELHSIEQNPPPAEVLTSSRDGQPYVIIMGADLGGQANPSDVLAYEKVGAEGKRYVLLMSRDVQQMTDEEFSQASFARGHKPTKN